MNLMLMNPDSFNEHYNCSYYDVNIHSLEDRINISYGIGLIIVAVIFECLYVPVLFVLWQPCFQIESCYRLMSIIVIIDIVAVTISGIAAGYFSIIGAVYCTCPWTMLILGTIGFFVWIAESDLAVILAFNRCICILSPNTSNSLFNGWRTYLWVLAALVHACVVCLTTNGLIYSSLAGVWVFNPHFGYPQSDFTFANKWQPFQNITVAFSLAFLYIIFVLSLIKKRYHNITGHIFTKRQKPIFIQVSIVSVLNFFIALLYVYEQHFYTPKILMQLSEVGWLCIHGAPAFIYLILNKSVRKQVLAVIFRISVSHSITPQGGLVGEAARFRSNGIQYSMSSKNMVEVQPSKTV